MFRMTKDQPAVPQRVHCVCDTAATEAAINLHIRTAVRLKCEGKGLISSTSLLPKTGEIVYHFTPPPA